MTIGSELLFFKNLPSTNTRASELLKKKNIPEGTIVHTNWQSAGRGHAGSKWESQDGKNLLFSIILYPSTIEPSDQFLISMALSIGICDFLRRYTNGYSIKWPNDIYVKGDKIAGILIENSVMADRIVNSIAGIGLNINQVEFLSDAPNPVSLKTVTGSDYDLNICLTQLASDLDRRYKQVISEDYDQLQNEYISKLFRLNEWALFRDKDGNFTGRILSVSKTGWLQIEKKAGLKKEYSFKEIEFLQSHSNY